MQPGDFIKEPRDPYELVNPYACQTFIYREKIPCVLGSFDLTILLERNEVGPSEATIQVAQQLLNRFQQTEMDVVALVFEQYLLACRDVDWMKLCDVPIGLTTDQLRPYLEPRLEVCYFPSSFGDPYEACVSLGPQWDPEHGLVFVHDGRSWVKED